MIITFAQIKGGVGKSTALINLGVALAETGAKVGMLDTDSQQTLHNWYNRRLASGRADDMECMFVQGALKDSLVALKKRNDFVLVDTAGFKNVSLGPALVNSDYAVCPFAPKPYDLEVARTLKQHESIETALLLNSRLKVRALLNHCPTNARDSRANEAEEYLTNEGFDVLASRLCRREAYGDAGQTGMGVTEYDDQKAILEIKALMGELTNG